MANPIFAKAIEAFGKPVVESIGERIKDERQLNSMRSALQDLYKSIEQEEIARTTVPMPTGIGAGGVLEMGQMQVPQTPQIQAELGELQKRKDYLMNHPLYGGLIRGEIKSVDEAKARESVQFPVSQPIKEEWQALKDVTVGKDKVATLLYDKNSGKWKLSVGGEKTSKDFEISAGLAKSWGDRWSSLYKDTAQRYETQLDKWLGERMKNDDPTLRRQINNYLVTQDWEKLGESFALAGISLEDARNMMQKDILSETNKAFKESVLVSGEAKYMTEAQREAIMKTQLIGDLSDKITLMEEAFKKQAEAMGELGGKLGEKERELTDALKNKYPAFAEQIENWRAQGRTKEEIEQLIKYWR